MAQQDHIHLSLTLNGSPEFEPDMEWAVTQRSMMPRIHLEMSYSLSGKLKTHTLNSGGNPIQYKDYKYSIKVGDYGGLNLETRQQALLDMNGQQVKLCDIFHADDGADHTSDIVLGILKVGEFPKFDQGLSRFYVDIEIVDDNQ